MHDIHPVKYSSIDSRQDARQRTQALMMMMATLEFWLNSCPKTYSQLSVLAVDLLAAPASQAFVQRLCSVCGMLSHGRRNRMEKSL